MDKSLKKGQILQGSTCMSIYRPCVQREKAELWAAGAVRGQCGLHVSRRSIRGKHPSDC